jgi:hypothetical protein
MQDPVAATPATRPSISDELAEGADPVPRYPIKARAHRREAGDVEASATIDDSVEFAVNCWIRSLGCRGTLLLVSSRSHEATKPTAEPLVSSRLS